MLTRKHFQAIANVLKDSADDAKALTEHNPDDAQARAVLACTERIAGDMARMLRRENPSFDHQRFLTACGFPDA